MRAILLDGSFADDTTGGRIGAALTAAFEARDWEVESIVLREKTIGICAGDFFCWVRTPGVCSMDDDNRAIAAAIAVGDVIVYLTPVTFGGYSSALKRMVDHQIQNVLPYFATIAGETHHYGRYAKNADLLAIGWTHRPDAQAEAVFHHLVRRNAINLHAKTSVSAVVTANQSDEQLLAAAQLWHSQLQHGASSAPAALPESGGATTAAAGIRRALLLVGSPRTRKSTSNALGGYLFEQLNAKGVQTETIYLHTHMRSRGMPQLFGALEAADLLVLAFPLYVDSLPALVTDALERIAAHRQGPQARRPLFAAIANCGFPETRHNATALAICEIFARQAQFAWAGSLALGGGEMIRGVPLAEGGARTVRIRKALCLAASGLVDGQAIPQAARDMLRDPVIPHWLYRFIGQRGWKQRAKRYGAQGSLKRQPYLTA